MLKNYFPPTLSLIYVEVEQGFATTSATATFIGPTEENSPSVDAWDGTPNSSLDNPFPTHIENW